MNTTPTDPDAIDLDGIGQRYVAGDLADKTAMVIDLIAAVKVLRARVAELAEALDKFREHVLKYVKVWEAEGGSHHHPIWGEVADVLAAMPAEALERARAVEEVVKTLRRIDAESWDDMDPDDGLHGKSARAAARETLAKLDALGKFAKAQ